MFRNILPAALIAGTAGLAAAAQFPDTYATCRDADDPQSGIAACRDAVKSPALLETERAYAYLMLATYQQRAGDLVAALASLDKSGAIARNSPLIPAERAVVYHLQGNLKAAMEAHDRAFALGPGNLAMFNNRGVTRLAMGDTQGAIADFDAALALVKEGVVYDNRAMAECRAGKAEASLNDRLAALANDGVSAADLEAVMAKSGFEGAVETGANAADPSGPLAKWTAAGCPGAPGGRLL